MESASLRVYDLPSSTLHSISLLTVAERTAVIFWRFSSKRRQERGEREERVGAAKGNISLLSPLARDSRFKFASHLPLFAD